MSTRREPLDPADATKLVLDQMRAVLDNPELSEDDHFFDWGGDSILAARVMQRVELVPGEWALWPDVAVRSVGFPADDVLRLVSPRAASAVT